MNRVMKFAPILLTLVLPVLYWLIAILWPSISWAGPLSCYEAARGREVRYQADIAGAAWKLPPGLLRAIVEQENRTWDPDVADGEAGEIGIAHVKPATVLMLLKWPTTPENLGKAATWLRNPTRCLCWAARYLAQAVEPYCKGDVRCLAAGYNAGQGTARYVAEVWARHSELMEAAK